MGEDLLSQMHWLQQVEKYYRKGWTEWLEEEWGEDLKTFVKRQKKEKVTQGRKKNKTGKCVSQRETAPSGIRFCTVEWWCRDAVWKGFSCKTHSVVEGDECRVVMLPCLLSCCSLGEDGRESVISSASSWADCDLVFFLLNACLKELRSCNTQDTNRLVISLDIIPGDIMSGQMRKIRSAISKQWPLSGLGKEQKSRPVRTDENETVGWEEGKVCF